MLLCVIMLDGGPPKFLARFVYRLVHRLLTQRPTRRDRLIKINKIKLNHCWPKRLCERILCCTRQPATNLWPIFFITWPVCHVHSVNCLILSACAALLADARTKFLFDELNLGQVYIINKMDRKLKFILPHPFF